MSAASVAIATKSVSNAVRKLVRGKGLFQKHESQLSPADCTFHWKYDKSVRVGTQSELTVMVSMSLKIC